MLNKKKIYKMYDYNNKIQNNNKKIMKKKLFKSNKKIRKI